MRDQPLCRALSPDPGDGAPPFLCAKQKGHQSRWHSNPAAKRKWCDGVKVRASWQHIDNEIGRRYGL